MSNTIEFTAYKTDEPYEVWMEPEPIRFCVLPGSTLKFIGSNASNTFTWAVRINHKNKEVQLFPESLDDYNVEVFENDHLLEDWYKYM